MNFASGDFKYRNLRFGSYEPVSMCTLFVLQAFAEVVLRSQMNMSNKKIYLVMLGKSTRIDNKNL